jgi:parallel beta-helix repeat protein
VSIIGYENIGGEAGLVENVTFTGFTVKNAGVNPPIITGTHTGQDDAANLTDNTASWTPGELVGQWVTNAGDYIDNSGGRQFFRAEITANTATTLTATYISGGDEKDWDIGDTYIISPYREWYDGALDGRDDVRGIRITSGRNIVIEDCKVHDCGDRGISVGRSRFDPRTPSEDITISNCQIIDNHDGGIGVGDTKGTITITGNTVSNNNNPTTEGCTYSAVGPPDCHITGMHIGGRSTSETLTGTISGNTVSDNAYHGITVYKYTDGFIVEGNIVTGHNLNSEGAGIFLSTGWGFTKHCKNHIVQNNTVTGNIRGIIAYYAWGDNPGDLVIEGNTISTDAGTFETGQAAIKIDHAYNLAVNDNIISCDGVGIRAHSGDTYNNTFSGNTVDGAMFAGVYVTSGAHDNTFANNTIKNTIEDTFTQYADWGSHTGADNAAVLTDDTKSWTSGAFIGFNDATTLTAVLDGGTDNDWDFDDEHDVTYGETQADGIFLRGGSCYAGGHAGTGNVFNLNAIYGNTDDGMKNQTATVADAAGNWWGDASGPHHPTTNAAATGDSVSNNVDYSPWWSDNYLGDAHTLPWVWYLDNSNNSTLQEGVDWAADGDSVEVLDGTYDVPVNVEGRNNLTFTGESQANTIFMPAITLDWNIMTYGSARQACIRVVSSEGIVFRNMTMNFDLVRANYVYGALLWNSSGELSDNLLQNMSVDDVSGGYCEITSYAWAPDRSELDRAQVSFLNNTFRKTGRLAILTHGWVEALIEGNDFDMVDDNFGYAIEIGSHSIGTVRGNTFNNYDTWALTDQSSSGAIYIENAFTSETYAPGLGHVDKPVTIEENEISACQFGVIVGNSYPGLNGDVDINATIAHNQIHDNATTGSESSRGISIVDEDKDLGSSVTADIDSNTIVNNGDYGIHVSTDGNGNITSTLTWNVITGQYNGVVVKDYSTSSASSYDLTIHHNTFDNNLNAEDDAAGGFWDDGTSVGNCWSDFESNPGYPNQYEVPGNAGTVDRHPTCYWQCDCADYCDLNLDGSIDPLDVSLIVNYVYLAQDARQQIPSCPKDNGDWNCDDSVDPLDVSFYVNFVYKAWGEPCDPCELITSSEETSNPFAKSVILSGAQPRTEKKVTTARPTPIR